MARLRTGRQARGHQHLLAGEGGGACMHRRTASMLAMGRPCVRACVCARTSVFVFVCACVLGPPMNILGSCCLAFQATHHPANSHVARNRSMVTPAPHGECKFGDRKRNYTFSEAWTLACAWGSDLSETLLNRVANADRDLVQIQN
eukprot:2197615-Alexandrium_andersonii.AAC.1